jgi:hypothetical protein
MFQLCASEKYLISLIFLQFESDSTFIQSATKPARPQRQYLPPKLPPSPFSGKKSPSSPRPALLTRYQNHSIPPFHAG